MEWWRCGCCFWALSASLLENHKFYVFSMKISNQNQAYKLPSLTILINLIWFKLKNKKYILKLSNTKSSSTNILKFIIYIYICILFLPHSGNKMFKWYTIGIIYLLELLLMTHVFFLHFQLDNPLIQLEDFKWINIFYFH